MKNLSTTTINKLNTDTTKIDIFMYDYVYDLVQAKISKFTGNEIKEKIEKMLLKDLGVELNKKFLMGYMIYGTYLNKLLLAIYDYKRKSSLIKKKIKNILEEYDKMDDFYAFRTLITDLNNENTIKSIEKNLDLLINKSKKIKISDLEKIYSLVDFYPYLKGIK